MKIEDMILECRCQKCDGPIIIKPLIDCNESQMAAIEVILESVGLKKFTHIDSSEIDRLRATNERLRHDIVCFRAQRDDTVSQVERLREENDLPCFDGVHLNRTVYQDITIRKLTKQVENQCNIIIRYQKKMKKLTQIIEDTFGV